MINPPKHREDYADRPLDCQEAVGPGFQVIIDWMLEVGWTRGETLRALKRLIAADNMAQLAIARAMMRAGKPL
ncbi:hypothetical protein EN933_04760 [Mesorhizobium sp. M7A.F.Ca.US.001.01.1.1]|nr:hypothetical protein EN933_04760 [Mesorhizobium sp. M7A.F.Ca.US.001.01.1.1]